MKSELIFQSSPWFIILCLLAGAAYAVLLYQKKSNFSVLQNRLLAVARGLLVALLAFLLINPLLRSNKTTIEKPTVVFAIDNSTSMAQGGQEKLTQLKGELQKLKDDIESKGSSVEIKTFDEEGDNKDINGINFGQKTSDLSGLLANVKNNYEGRNLTDVILVSDGIANAGISPTYGKYNFNIHSIGLGDTTLKKDVKLNAGGAKAIYLDVHSYLHIYMRHVEEMKVTDHFEHKDNFQWKEEDVFTVIKHVIQDANDDIQKFFVDKPDGRYSCYGGMSRYFEGDYYTFHIEKDGRLSTFHKNKK
ncbi:MAG: VWA domain-containing protein [Flavobacterium sp.]|nr:MAG: VWA domain-containing protein [Flavobacterium sp.]